MAASLCRKRTPGTPVDRVTASQDGVLALSSPTTMTAGHGVRRPALLLLLCSRMSFFASIPMCRASVERFSALIAVRHGLQDILKANTFLPQLPKDHLRCLL